MANVDITVAAPTHMAAKDRRSRCYCEVLLDEATAAAAVSLGAAAAAVKINCDVAGGVTGDREGVGRLHVLRGSELVE
jgi:hypothetical protein